MIQYEEIHDLLQTQVDNGELSVSEATLVNDIAFIGGGGKSHIITEGEKSSSSGLTQEEQAAKEKAQRLSKDYKELNTKFKHQMKQKDYR